MGESHPDPAAGRRTGFEPAPARRESLGNGTHPIAAADPKCLIETVVCPFHCLYQDALHFHTQSQRCLPRSEAESSRLARAALVLYLASAESLVHQAAVELGRPDLASLVANPERPLPPEDAWRLLPAIVAEGAATAGAFSPDLPPWPAFSELLALRASWAYPGPATARRAYYHAPDAESGFEPVDPHQIPPGFGLSTEALAYPRTGLPRDPYALRPRHLDTARSVLDAAIAALDRRLGGALTADQRHRREPIRRLENRGRR
jgi:hypothetical protein